MLWIAQMETGNNTIFFQILFNFQTLRDWVVGFRTESLGGFCRLLKLPAQKKPRRVCFFKWTPAMRNVDSLLCPHSLCLGSIHSLRKQPSPFFFLIFAGNSFYSHADQWLVNFIFFVFYSQWWKDGTKSEQKWFGNFFGIISSLTTWEWPESDLCAHIRVQHL